MKLASYNAPECLEQRIAPAGLVSFTFNAGVLTIDGSDGADHDVTIVKTGLNTFRVDGDATDIGVAGQTSKSFRGALTAVLFTGGSGADTLEVVNLSPLRSFQFDGNGGVDALSTSNLKTKAGGTVDISLGAEGGSVNFDGARTYLRGTVDLDLGGGGSASFASTSTIVNGAVTVTGGLESDSLAFTGGTTLLRSSITFNGGDGDDFFTSTGRSFVAKGLVDMDGGAGANQFLFGAANTTIGKSLTPGGIDLNLGTGAGNVVFEGVTSRVLGAVTIDLGTGGGSAQLNSITTSIRDAVEVTGGIGNDRLEFNGRVSIGRSLTFLGDAGDDTLSAGGAQLSVKGATNMDGGAGAATLDLHPTLLALASLNFTGGTENDTVSIIANGIIAGNANLQLGIDGTGPSSTVLQSKTGTLNGLKFGGTLTIDMVGATVDTLTITNVQVAKAFVAQTGEGVSTVDISRMNALANFQLQTGSGADVVNVDNVNAVNFHLDTQIGADELRIERNATYLGGSRVLGTATILTGIGADQIRIGDASNNADLRVVFRGAMTLDAGDGANMRNDILAANVFGPIPTILSTDGTLTETQAV